MQREEERAIRNHWLSSHHPVLSRMHLFGVLPFDENVVAEFEESVRDAQKMYYRMFQRPGSAHNTLIECERLNFRMRPFNQENTNRDLQYLNAYMIPQERGWLMKSYNAREKLVVRIVPQLDTFSLRILNALYESFKKSRLKIKYGSILNRRVHRFRDILLSAILIVLGRPRNDIDMSEIKINPVIYCQCCQVSLFERMRYSNRHCDLCSFTMAARFRTQIFELPSHFRNCRGDRDGPTPTRINEIITRFDLEVAESDPDSDYVERENYFRQIGNAINQNQGEVQWNDEDDAIAMPLYMFLVENRAAGYESVERAMQYYDKVFPGVNQAALCSRLSFVLFRGAREEGGRDLPYLSSFMSPYEVLGKSFTSDEMYAIHTVQTLHEFDLPALELLRGKYIGSNIKIKFGPNVDRKVFRFQDIIQAYICMRTNSYYQLKIDFNELLMRPIPYCRFCAYTLFAGLISSGHCDICAFSCMTRFHTPIFELSAHYDNCIGDDPFTVPQHIRENIFYDEWEDGME